MKPLTGRFLALALAVGAAACSDSSNTQAQTQFPGGLVAASASVDPLLLLLAAGPESVAHSGLRQVELHHKAPGHVEEVIVYREAIAVDTRGQYSLVPVESLAPGGLDEELFLALQANHEGFNFRYRDFRVRDLGAFQANYTLGLVAEDVEHMGRQCLLLEVDARSGTGTDYDLLVDELTGLVLASQVTDAATGVLLQRTTYLSVEFEEPNGFTPHAPSNAEAVLDLGQPLAPQAGFEPILPSFLPSGYVMTSAATVVDPDENTWFMLVCTDGVEPLFVLERNLESGVEPINVGRLGTKTQVQHSANDLEQSGMNVDAELLGYRSGRVGILQGAFPELERIAVGTRPMVELQLTIESTLP
ncbi:MAG: hypothetical protein AAFZ65_18055 [Planctomycetota bacterium]